MYLPRSAALLGSRAICKEKRNLGQEAPTAPLPGNALRLCGLQRPQRLFLCIRLYPSQSECRRTVEILLINPEAFQSKQLVQDHSPGCLVGEPGSVPACLDIIRLIIFIINTIHLFQTFIKNSCLKHLRNYYVPGPVLRSKVTTVNKTWSRLLQISALRARMEDMTYRSRVCSGVWETVAVMVLKYVHRFLDTPPFKRWRLIFCPLSVGCAWGLASNE